MYLAPINVGVGLVTYETVIIFQSSQVEPLLLDVRKHIKV